MATRALMGDLLVLMGNRFPHILNRISVENYQETSIGVELQALANDFEAMLIRHNALSKPIQDQLILVPQEIKVAEKAAKDEKKIEAWAAYSRASGALNTAQLIADGHLNPSS